MYIYISPSFHVDDYEVAQEIDPGPSWSISTEPKKSWEPAVFNAIHSALHLKCWPTDPIWNSACFLLDSLGTNCPFRKQVLLCKFLTMVNICPIYGQ